MGDEDLKEETGLEAQGSAHDQSVASGVGALLRNEREKQGLTLEKVADATKLRRHFIEALEREKWEALPPPVFVKGFIRSYARTLRLNDQEVVALYERTAPTASAPHRFYVDPPRGRKWAVLLVMVLICVGGLSYYLWKDYTTLKETSPPAKAPRPAIKTGVQGLPAQDGQSPKAEEKRTEQVVKTPAEVVEKPAGQGLETPAEPSLPRRQEKIAGEVPPQEATPAPAEQPPALPAESVAPQEPFILRADIRERTWIRICVDEEEPKEYVFQPGSRPQWEAKKGFYVVVGNAGGASFEFNGEWLKDLGREGQVVRLRLPEDFQAVNCEE